MEKRIEVLRKIVASGNDLEEIRLDYKVTYKKMNKMNVIHNLEGGLTELLKYLLKN